MTASTRLRLRRQCLGAERSTSPRSTTSCLMRNRFPSIRPTYAAAIGITGAAHDNQFPHSTETAATKRLEGVQLFRFRSQTVQRIPQGRAGIPLRQDQSKADGENASRRWTGGRLSRAASTYRAARRNVARVNGTLRKWCRTDRLPVIGHARLRGRPGRRHLQVSRIP